MPNRSPRFFKKHHDLHLLAYGRIRHITLASPRHHCQNPHPMNSKTTTIHFQPRFSTLVAIDSDGAVFNTAEIKQRRFFHPSIVAYWGLEKVAAAAVETAEFVNLYSRQRGPNRFIGLLAFFDLLRRHPAVVAAHISLPDTAPLRAYVHSGLPLCHDTLAAEIARTGSQELQRVLNWSQEVSKNIATQMGPVPPFPGAAETIALMAKTSDLIVSSQTTITALEREWREHNLAQYVAVIAAQEHGTKTEHLRQVKGSHYRGDQILMIGDAPGDHAAARSVDALFYPILPSREGESWQRLASEAYPKFLAGQYAGAYQEELLANFYELLPTHPHWEKKGASCG